MTEPGPATRILRAAIIAGLVATLAGGGWMVWRSDRTAFLPGWSGAEWVVFPTPPDSAILSALPTAARFRTEFVSTTAPAEIQVAVAVNRRGVLWINGEAIGGLRLDGQDWKRPRATRIPGGWVAGTNRIELVVTNTVGPPAAWVRLSAGGAVIQSDARWEVSLAGSAWRSAALARARPVILRGNLLYAADFESRRWPLLPLGVVVGLAVVLGLCWGRMSTSVGRWLDSPRWWVGPAVVVAALWVALAYNNLPQLPRLYGFDAEGHEEYIRYLQEHHRLPLAKDGWQMYQPPLYYGLAAAVLAVTGHRIDEAAAVGILRWCSIAIGLAHCAVIFLCLRLLFPADRWKQLVGTWFAAFLPAHLVVAHYITNENLCAFWVTVAIYWFLRTDLTGGGEPRDLLDSSKLKLGPWVACGISLGLALLTKFTAVLVLPALFAALGWTLLRHRARWDAGAWRPVGGLLLALLLTCGWHYGRVWLAYGTPLVGNWDAASGFAWWQFPGYRTWDYYAGFGVALSQPWFSSVASYADGIWSTFWADGLASGAATVAFAPPWNYRLMQAAGLMGVVGSFGLVVGLIIVLVRLWRKPSGDQILVAGSVLILGLGLTYMTLRVPSYAQVKAFYGLCALLPLAVLFVNGCTWLTRGGRWGRGIVAGLLLGWAGLSFGSLWVRTGNPQTHVVQGIWLFDRGQFEPALRCFQQALELAPGHATAAARATETLLRLGRVPEALDLAERASQVAPTASDVKLQLANALAAAGDTNRVMVELPAAAHLGPQDLRPWHLLAFQQWQAGQPAAAISAAREGLAIAPYEPTLHALIGINLATLGDLTNALWHLDFACRVKPDLVIAQAQLGRLLLASGRACDAVGPLTVAVRAHASDVDLRRLYAAALQQCGQGSAAAAAWRAAISLAPDQPDLLNNLAWLLATAPDPAVRDGAEAVRLAERACDLTGRRQPALLGTLAAAQAAAGQFERAITEAEAAIRLARDMNQSDLVERNQELLTLYRAGRPYVQPSPSP